MSSVNEQIVRDYFETLGFLVRQPCKYIAPGRHKSGTEDADLLVVNPQVRKARLPDRIIWTTQDVRAVARAVVGVRGWHSWRFSAAHFRKAPEILRFAEPGAVESATKRMGGDEAARILCLAQLPASSALREKALDVLREKGIDGVLTFPTMLAELLRGVDKHHNYEKSDVLQMLRILKIYDLIKDSQMELFPTRNSVSRRTRRPAARAKTSRNESAPDAAPAQPMEQPTQDSSQEAPP